MKTILVTGGAGFIGSNLCARLLKEGNRIICVDNLFSGRHKNIEPLLGDRGFIFLNLDLTSNRVLEKPLEGIGIDEIYNLACPASPPRYQADPHYTMKTNINGAFNVGEFARYRKIKKILHTSTSEVYGDPLVHPQTEEYRGNVNTSGPRACYDEGKRAAETILSDYQRRYGIPIKIVRIFNTYGPNMDPLDGRVVSNIIRQAIKGEPITIYGDGTQTRSFQYVDDLIEGMIKFMESDVTGILNMGNPHEIQVNELKDIILRKINIASSVTTYTPLPEDDPLQRKPVIDKAKSLLAWEPKINISDGLDKTIQYFRNIIIK